MAATSGSSEVAAAALLGWSSSSFTESCARTVVPVHWSERAISD
jgi:hypothetical protein